MTSHIIYLDYNATTPVDDLVLESMMPFFKDNFGNAASKTHLFGRMASEAVEKSRQIIADFIECEPGEIIFTSGSTESANMAIKGVAEVYKSKGKHIITWQTEHRAVLDTCKSLEAIGYEITSLSVNRDGQPDLNHLEKAIRKDTILVALMLANNETGVIMPVEEIARIVHSKDCMLFCDATQAAGKMRVIVNELGADLLCLSAHKMYGPKGTGILFVRRKNPRVKLSSIIEGGGHENGLRSGTLNVPGIVGMGKAAEICMANYWDETSRYSKLRTILEQSLDHNGMGYVNGDTRNRIPNTSNIYFPGIKASMLITALPSVALATGSACSSALPEPSHVLKAMGLSEVEAFSSIRLSIGRFTLPDEITRASELIIDAVGNLRKQSKAK